MYAARVVVKNIVVRKGFVLFALTLLLSWAAKTAVKIKALRL